MNAKLRFLPHGLTMQEAPREQSQLFVLEPSVVRCDHNVTEIQKRLDGGYDKLCMVCGDVVLPR